MSVQVRFVGGAQTVTGSRHLVETDETTVLLDCGMFQGRRAEARERNTHLGFRALDIGATVLSHAHIDHSGALPVLAKNGFAGAIYVTPATRDLCAAMLKDSAMIAEEDADYLNRVMAKQGIEGDPIEPLYRQADVDRALRQMITVAYHVPRGIAPGVGLTFLDAGHVLGSAIVQLDIEDGGQKKRLVFSGDLGRYAMPLLRDPEVPDGASSLMLESTYGARLHASREQMDVALAEVINDTYAKGGKVIIPSFALERAQEIVYSLKKLRAAHRIPALPVYVDSPLTVRITDVFRDHPECFDAATAEMFGGEESPFDFDGLRYVTTKEDSKAIDASSAPCVIIAASGMCEAGRVLHHLKVSVDDPRNTIVIVGFQAGHTLGRRLAERREHVRIFGVEHRLRANVVVLDGFSAHADQRDLMQFAMDVRARGALREVMLVHGERPAQETLRGLLEAKDFVVHVPAPGDVVALS